MGDKVENVYEFLVNQAKTQGYSNVLHHVKRFIREGSKVVDGTPDRARREVPRAWVEKGYVKQHGRCMDCSQVMNLYGDPNDPLYATWDHSEAHSRGGAHSRRDGRVICRGCNSKKRDRSPLEYSKSSGHLMSNLIAEEE